MEALFCIEISRKGQGPFDGGEMGLVKVGIGPFKDGDVLMSLLTVYQESVKIQITMLRVMGSKKGQDPSPPDDGP